MREYDDAVLECFLDKQLQLFPEAVAETLDEAEDLMILTSKAKITETSAADILDEILRNTPRPDRI